MYHKMIMSRINFGIFPCIFFVLDKFCLRILRCNYNDNQSCKSKNEIGLIRLLCKYACLDVLTKSAMIKKKYINSEMKIESL